MNWKGNFAAQCIICYCKPVGQRKMWSNSIMFEKNTKAEIILFSFVFLLWGFPIKTYSFIFMLSKVNWKEMIVCWSVKRQQKHFKDFSIFVIHTRKGLYSCTRGFVHISNIWHKNNSRLRVFDLNIHEILMVDTRMWNILENVTSRIRLQKNAKKNTTTALWFLSWSKTKHCVLSKLYLQLD